VNKNRLVDLFVVGRPARKEYKVFSFHSLHDKYCHLSQWYFISYILLTRG